MDKLNNVADCNYFHLHLTYYLANYYHKFRNRILKDKRIKDHIIEDIRSLNSFFQTYACITFSNLQNTTQF